MISYPKSLLEFALLSIRENISNGRYAPGTKLSAKNIADELKISQTPVKEAINRLVSEGLVEAIPRRGHVVRLFSAADFMDFLRIGAMIEAYAASFAVQNVPRHPDLMSRMEENLKACDGLEETTSAVAYLSKELEFHILLIELSENRQLRRLYEMNWNVIISSYSQAMDIPLIHPRTTIGDHWKLFKLLKDGDAEGIRQLMLNHKGTSLIAVNALSQNEKMKLLVF